MARRFLLILLILLTLDSCQRQRITLSSPNHETQACFFLDSIGSPCLDISFLGKPQLSISHIGLSSADSTLPHQGFSVAELRILPTIETTDTLLWGENKIVKTHYRPALARLVHPSGHELVVEWRVFNDGVAFRFHYIFPDSDSTAITGETTTYRFARQGICWSIPANFESYEFEYRQLPIAQTADANTPFTFKLDQDGSYVYGAIHEAALEQMPEMTLVATDSLLFATWLAPDNSGTGTVGSIASGQSSAWRTITLSRQAVDLINSQLILSCNPPCSHPENYRWIRPLKYIGIWWGMHLGINSWTPDHRHGATTANALALIDFASHHNIDAVLFEGWNLGWEQWGGKQEFDFTHAAPDFDVERVISYAQAHNVEIIMHHETGGNIPHYEEQMDSTFAWCQAHGIHYVKTGYAGGFPNRHLHHSQYGVNHYARVVDCAAKYQIALDVHEPIKPTGICHTYPNLMTAEGARGMEWNAWSDGNTPSHQATLPFTRLLAGPMDYTPGIFDITYESVKSNPNLKQWNMKDARECRVHTTLAKQCALWVVLYSPLVMASDLIENYLLPQKDGALVTHPMFHFFEEFDPDCDWSQAIDGEPGQWITIVRRAKDRYFVGSITNEESREITLNLNFLETNKRYVATCYGDGPDADYLSNPTQYQITQSHVTAHDKLHLHLAAGGGCALSFKPE